MQTKTRRVVARALLPPGEQRAAIFKTLAEAIQAAIEAEGAQLGSGNSGHGRLPLEVSNDYWEGRGHWAYLNYASPTTMPEVAVVGSVQAWLLGEGQLATLIVTITEARYLDP